MDDATRSLRERASEWQAEYKRLADEATMYADDTSAKVLYGAGQVALNHADEAVRAACCDAIMRTLDIIEGATPFGALGCFMAKGGVDADEIRDRIIALRTCVAIAVAEE